MLHIKKAVFIFFGSILFISCNNEGTTVSPSGNPAVWGKMSAIKESRKVINGADTVVSAFEIGIAQFLADPAFPSVFIDAGIVSVNNIELVRDANNLYLKKVGADSTPSSLGYNTSIEWHVAGNTIVPASSYKDIDSFPDYTGAIPSAISKSAGFDLLFDSTTVSGADSVRVFINDPLGNTAQQTFPANGGLVSVFPPTLASLSLVNDNAAFIAIMPYRGVIKVFRNKGYFFARERRIYQSLSITN